MAQRRRKTIATWVPATGVPEWTLARFLDEYGSCFLTRRQALDVWGELVDSGHSHAKWSGTGDVNIVVTANDAEVMSVLSVRQAQLSCEERDMREAKARETGEAQTRNTREAQARNTG